MVGWTALSLWAHCPSSPSTSALSQIPWAYGPDLTFPIHWPNTGPDIAHGVGAHQEKSPLFAVSSKPTPRTPNRTEASRRPRRAFSSLTFSFRPSATAASNDDHGEDGRFLWLPRPPPPPTPRRRRVGLPRRRCRRRRCWVGAPLPLPPLVSSSDPIGRMLLLTALPI